MICETQSGYVWSMTTYTGKGKKFDKDSDLDDLQLRILHHSVTDKSSIDIRTDSVVL